MKKIVSILLTIAMLCSLVPAFAEGVDIGVIDAQTLQSSPEPTPQPEVTDMPEDVKDGTSEDIQILK